MALRFEPSFFAIDWNGKMENQLLDKPTEIDLLRRAKTGDFTAFQQLVNILQPRVFGLAFRILKQTQDAEDVTQQTFLALIEHIADFREESSLASWVLKIATNQALKILRKKRTVKMVSMTDMASEENYSDIPHPEFIAPWSQTAEEIVQQAEVQAELEICEEFTQHLAGCKPCQVVVNNIRQTISLYRDGQPYPMPKAFEERLQQSLKSRWEEKFRTSVGPTVKG